MLKDCYISLQQLDSIANNIIRIFNLVYTCKQIMRTLAHANVCIMRMRKIKNSHPSRVACT